MIPEIIFGAGALIVGAFGFKPLKEAAEYRFQKPKKVMEGAMYIGAAAIVLLTGSWWVWGAAGVTTYLVQKQKSKNKLLN